MILEAIVNMDVNNAAFKEYFWFYEGYTQYILVSNTQETPHCTFKCSFMGGENSPSSQVFTEQQY